MSLIFRKILGRKLTSDEVDGNFKHLEDTKVTKVDGEGLSPEKFTLKEKRKLASFKDLLKNITQELIDEWNTVTGKLDKGNYKGSAETLKVDIDGKIDKKQPAGVVDRIFDVDANGNVTLVKRFDKVHTKQQVADLLLQMKNETIAILLNNPDADVNSIKELHNLISNNLTQLSTKLSFKDAQSLTEVQRKIAWSNLKLPELLKNYSQTLIQKWNGVTGKLDKGSYLGTAETLKNDIDGKLDKKQVAGEEGRRFSIDANGDVSVAPPLPVGAVQKELVPARNLLINSKGDFTSADNGKILEVDVSDLRIFKDKHVYVACEIEFTKDVGGIATPGLKVIFQNSAGFTSVGADLSSGNVIGKNIRQTSRHISMLPSSLTVKLTIPDGCIVRNCFLGFGYVVHEDYRNSKTVPWAPNYRDLELKFKSITQGYRFKDLSNDLNVKSYRHGVIAMCDLTNSNPGFESWSRIDLLAHRSNGAILGLNFTAQLAKKHNTNEPWGTLIKNIPVPEVKVCTFLFEGKKYGGIHFFVDDARYDYICINWQGRFEPFALDYKEVKSGTTTILNAEVANSLTYPTVNIRQGAIQLV